MTYRVLLVDDELYDLEWLKQAVPWEELGLVLAGTAHSGFAALGRMKEERIDILLTDIRMPIMTGLEMAAQAKELYPWLKVICISGYEDFHYAKQAIALSAVGYVLKPIELDEVVRLLQDTARMLDSEHQLQERRVTLDRTLPLVRGAFLMEWLEGSMDAVEGAQLIKQQELLPCEGVYCAAVLEIDDLQWKLAGYPKEEHGGLVEQTQQLVMDTVKELMLGHVLVDGNRLVLLMERFEEAETGSLLLQLVERVRQAGPFTLTIGISYPPVMELSQLPGLYKQACELLEFKMFVGKSRVIWPEDMKPKVLQGAHNLEEKLEELLTCMLDYDLVGIDDHLLSVFQLVQHTDTRLSVYNFTLHLIAQLDKLFVRLGENLYDLLSWDYKNLDVLFQFETVDDIVSWLRRRLFEMAELMMRKMQKGNHKLVHDIQSYTGEHLSDKLTLRSLSQTFGFTPNYLGHLFKEHTGEGYTDYLMRRRLEKACELLSDPVLKIYEVSDAVGYKNIIYFNRHFKEFYGMTPTEYRRKG